MKYCSDVLILGAGAAGLMCAIEAGKRGRSVTVLESSPRAGQKILISGGGRCNFTNRAAGAANFLSENPHFAKSALARYTPQHFLAMVERHRIGWHEKKLGQLFCDRSAQEILTMLERECAQAGVRVKLGTVVRVVRYAGCAADSLLPHLPTEGRYGAPSMPMISQWCPTSAAVSRCGSFTALAGEHEYAAEALVVATGGLSIPKMGATAFGYELARQFGLSVVEPRPALVALTLGAEDARRWCDLAGISAEVVASVGQPDSGGQSKPRASFREKMLVTHRGFSGPAILQISSYWRPGEMVRLDLAPERQVFAAMLTGTRQDAPLRPLAQGRQDAPPRPQAQGRRDASAALAALREVLPARLAERWLELNPITRWTNAALEEAERRLHRFEFVPVGTEGFGKAEVTAGGVDTSELSSRTMEAKRVPGLYFVGEVVDVTGWLGGFNFQWAWASGYSAGQAV
jgi:predicted Rossmann fold flavoprotein